MKSISTLFLVLFTGISFSQPQNIIESEELLKKYLIQTSFDIDSSAQAIVLYEKGTFYFTGSSQTFRIDRVVKILGSDAFDEGNVVINCDDESFVRKASGTTYNYENGAIVKQSVERQDKFREKLTEDVSVVKFSLPNVKKRSIIYYSYTKEIEGSLFIPDWYFQGQYPKLYSIFETILNPEFFYTTVERSSIVMEKVNRRKELKTCRSCCLQENVSNQNIGVWVRSDVPAFKHEPHMLSEQNYMEMLRTNITAISNNGYKEPIFKDWDQVNDEIYYKNESLGGQVFGSNNFLEKKVGELTAGDTSQLEKAKHIFSYVRDNIYYKNDYSKAYRNIKNVFNNRKGNVRGINFLLTAMLRKAGLDAEPVLIASRQSECLSPLYTDISNIDYLVAKVNINNIDYYMDGSKQFTSFNVLPSFCYNGMARTINKQAKTIFLEPDSLRDRNVTMVNVFPLADYKLSVKLEYVLGDVTAYNFRNTYNGDSVSACNAISKSIERNIPDLTITSKKIQNISQPDLPLKIIIEGLIALEQAHISYFNPYFDKFFLKNPFEAESRQYPIVMENRENQTYILSLKLPSGYAVDDYPKSSVVRYEGSSAIDFKNTFIYDEAQNIFKVQSQFIRNTTSFDTEEYKRLREFYDHVIAGQNKKIVIKKIDSK